MSCPCVAGNEAMEKTADYYIIGGMYRDYYKDYFLPSPQFRSKFRGRNGGHIGVPLVV